MNLISVPVCWIQHFLIDRLSVDNNTRILYQNIIGSFVHPNIFYRTMPSPFHDHLLIYIDVV